MFSPVGYIVLPDLWMRCLYIGNEKANTLGAHLQDSPIRVPEGASDWAKDHFFIGGIWADFYFERYLSLYGNDVFVCSPKGTLLRVSQGLTALVKEYDFHPSDPIEQAMRHSVDSYSPYSRFLYIDENTSIVKKPIGVLSARQEAEWLAISNFLGWSVCLAEEALPKTLADFDKLDWRLAGEKTKPIGRPRKTDFAQTIYNSVFPKGHEADGLSWKEAVVMIKQRSGGQSLSVTTLKRSLGRRS